VDDYVDRTSLVSLCPANGLFLLARRRVMYTPRHHTFTHEKTTIYNEQTKHQTVEFVEFLAPSGAVAYATLKGKGGGGGKNKKDGSNPNRIRIGQGYPTGAKGSWSSPDFVIRSVSNYGVPYKFTVPALATAKYTKK
jgi:hypothetical protein